MSLVVETVSFYTDDASRILAALEIKSPAFIWESKFDSRYSYVGIADAGLELSEISLPECLEFVDSNPHDFLTSLTVGFIAYDALCLIEDLPTVSRREGIPAVYFISSKQLVVIDHLERNLKCIGFSQVALKDFLAKLLDANIPRERKEISESKRKFSKDEFIELVNRAKEYLVAGDIFQVVLSNEVSFKGEVCPATLYKCLKDTNPSPYHFLISFDDKILVGASPETFLKSIKTEADQTKILMRPIAGTYPIDISDDQLLSFKQDYKERAEHVMLVDHARNDIGKVSKKGSVVVEEILAVESYAKVHHLVSKVSGILKEGEDIFSAIRACFPIATLTGTPKVRAMEIIAELEGSPRGIFGGAVCAFNGAGYFDSAVAIRSAIVGKNETIVQAGAGIVYDSLPEREYEECLWKMRSVIDGIMAQKKGG